MTATAPAAAAETRGLVAYADGCGDHTPAGGLEPQAHWTIEAAILLDPAVTDGVIAAVMATDLGCVRALVLRRGKLGLLAWSWKGGQALWPVAWTPVVDECAHVAAISNPAGDLVLYVDGRIVGSFAAGELFAGRQRQCLVVGGPVRFGDEVIPGWRGELRHVALYDRALQPGEVEHRARVAGTFVERSEPEREPERQPDPTGCPINSHSPAWRPSESGDGLRCLRCSPERGCPFDEHQYHWRPVEDDIWARGGGWKLECGLCLTAAARGVA